MLALVSLTACGSKYGQGVPEEYNALLDEAMVKAGDNAAELKTALKETPAAQREGMAFLIAYMPEGDLRTISKDILLPNVEYAYKTKEKFAWTRDLPKDIFLNEVLPYASVDETRENWRPGFFDMFSARVEGAPDMRAAADSVNRNLARDVQVDYNTAREKTNQSPSESMRQHMASCTGLSILLVDALRSVGIPARFAGTPAWHDDRGNHSWVEVWIEGKWYFTEFYPEQLDRAWFLADAGQADPADRDHSVFATSYRPTGDWFPMVWSPDSREIAAVNVSDRYVKIWKDLSAEREEAGTHVPVKFIIYKDKKSEGRSDGRVAANVDVFRGPDQMGGGRTSGPLKDMNDVLSFQLQKNGRYTFRYSDANGNPREVVAEVKDMPVTVTAYME